MKCLAIYEKVKEENCKLKKEQGVLQESTEGTGLIWRMKKRGTKYNQYKVDKGDRMKW